MLKQGIEYFVWYPAVMDFIKSMQGPYSYDVASSVAQVTPKAVVLGPVTEAPVINRNISGPARV